MNNPTTLLAGQIMICVCLFGIAIAVIFGGLYLWFVLGWRVVGFIVLVLGLTFENLPIYLWGSRKHVG